MIKAYTKLFVKRGLIVTAKTLAKSKTIRRVGKGVRATLFPENPLPIYNFSRYAPTIAQYQKQLKLSKTYKHQPLISIVMPTYNTPITYLRECIESVLVQSYPNWELCVADDTSSDKSVVRVIKEYMETDKRIKLIERTENGHISAATNSAIEIARGEFIALLDHDDELWPNALFEIVRAINKHPKVDLIYTDEDKIDANNDVHSYPFFKPDWSPEFLESCNYITHFSTIRKSLVDEVGGLRVGYEGAQDWDLLLRVTEKTTNIVHISKVLYSWRIHEDSTAMDTDAKPYVYEAQHKLLVDHIERSGEEAIVKQGVIKQHASIEYAVKGSPKISVIIAGGTPEALKKSISAAVKYSSYPSTELLFVVSNKKERAVCERMAHSRRNYKIVDAPLQQTLAASYNLAAGQASGDYLVFIDGSLAVRANNWLELLLADAQRKGVGAVSGKVTNRLGDRFLGAACATGIYGLYAPLLEGMPGEDIHYMRGLYGQSRRNVSVLNGYCMVSKQVFQDHDGFDETLDDLFLADFCLKLLESGLRNVYNPFIQAADFLNKTAGDADMVRDKQAIKKFQERWKHYIEYDPYFNPNFTRTNAQLEIK